MANKSIKQYNQTTTPQADDAVLIQRSNDYYYIEHSDLGFGKKRASVTLTATDVKALNSTPITLVSAAGAGVYLIPLHSYAIREAGTAYATNQTPQLYFSSSGVANYFFRFVNLLSGTSKLVRTGEVSSLDNQDMIANDAIEISASSDPTVGTGSVTIVLYYEERAL